MSEQKRYFIGNIHRYASHPGVVYASLYDRSYPEGEQMIANATIDYILDLARDRHPGEVEGVGEVIDRGKSPS